MRYWIEPGDIIFVKAMNSYPWKKTWAVGLDRSFLTTQKRQQLMPVTLPQRGQSEKKTKTEEAVGNQVGKKIVEENHRSSFKEYS